MSAVGLLRALRERGARLEASGGRLVVEAPDHVLTPVVVAALRREKRALLAILERERAEYLARRRAYVDAAALLDRLDDALAAAEASGQDVAEVEARRREAWERWERAAAAFDEAMGWPVSAEIRAEEERAEAPA